MLRFLTLIWVALICHCSYAGFENQELKSLYDASIRTLDDNPDSSKWYAMEIIRRATNQKAHYAKTQGHFVLGYLHRHADGNLGRSAIQYMEGIRICENESDDPELQKLSISLYKNLANIYVEYADWNAAIEKYFQALHIALEMNNTYQMTHLSWVIAQYYNKDQNHEQALDILEQARNYNQALGNKQLEMNIINTRGLVYKDMGEYDKGIAQFRQILEIAPGSDSSRADENMAWSLHNIASCYEASGLFDSAVHYYARALKLKENIDDNYSYFTSLRGLAESHKALGQFDQSEKYYLLAEQKSQTFNRDYDQEYLKFYASFAELYAVNGHFEKANKYQRVYSNKLTNYLEEQSLIELEDKRYNLSLITERYYEMVYQQERNQQIQWYGSLLIAFFILIIILVIVFNAYRNYTLRRDLEKSIKLIKESGNS
jgi:tetratricopeptide (TPR) repeat protein